MKSWQSCKKILCIRADNMGDVVMTWPAIRALKESFNSSITLLTSMMGSHIVPCLPGIDEALVYTLPWVKTDQSLTGEACLELVSVLREHCFDAAVIFTAYSQSALPAAMLAYMAGIPRRLAYCRENPYELLTDWVPDKEPYDHILHQVQRDLRLVAVTGADITNDVLEVQFSGQAKKAAFRKLTVKGVNVHEPWIIVHAGVSEKKREYPVEQWIQAVQMLIAEFDVPVLLTGSAQEQQQAMEIQQAVGKKAYAVAGLFTVEEFAAVINEACLVVSVNTATVHIAAAVNTPVIVLYAQTNPQHTPWKAYARVLSFSPNEQLQSKNEVIRYVNRNLYREQVPLPSPYNILRAAQELMAGCYPGKSIVV